MTSEVVDTARVGVPAGGLVTPVRVAVTGVEAPTVYPLEREQVTVGVLTVVSVASQ